MNRIVIEHEHREGFGEAFRDMPDVIADELLALRRNWYRHYIFYRRERGRVIGVCSRCGQKMAAHRELNGSGDFLEDLLHARHGENGLCPRCHGKATFLAAGRFRDFSTLTNYDNIVFILPVNGGQVVYLRCYTVYADYDAENPVRLCLVEKAHYRLAPGVWQAEKRSFPIWDCIAWHTLACYKGHHDGYFVGDWRHCKTPQEAWTGYMWYAPQYTFFHGEKLEDTFLKYSRVWDFNNIDPGRGRSTKLLKYLCHYTQKPSLEIAMRTEGGEAARELVYFGRSNRRLINWRAKDPVKFWRMSKAEFKATAGVGDRLEFLMACKQYFGRLPVEELARLYKDGAGNVDAFFSVMDILRDEDPMRVLRYCKKHSNQYIRYYRDYLEAALAVGRDLTVHNVRFPKDLQTAHDEAVATRMLMENEAKAKRINRLGKAHEKDDERRRRLYDYAEGDFFIRVAKDAAEVIAEGNILHHCVGGYAERHVTCKTTILVLRRAKAPLAPFYTVEMRDGKLMQVHGDHNRAIDNDGEAKEWFDCWLDRIASLMVKGGGPKASSSAKVQATERKAV